MCRIFRSVSASLRQRLRRMGTSTVALALCVGVCGQPVLAQNVYLISAEYDSDLAAAGDALPAEDTAEEQIAVVYSNMVTVDCDGELLVTTSGGRTVQELLDELEITLSEADICSVPLDTETYDGMCIEITRMTETTVTTEEVIAYETEYYEDETLAVGESQQVTAGVNGTAQCTWTVEYENGEEVSRVLVDTTVVTEPVNEVILVHTDRTIHEHDAMVVSDVEVEEVTISQEAASASSAAQSAETANTITTASGDTVVYSQVLTCTATAYTGGGTTATGTTARVGAIAVDPDVIPLGSVLYIVSDDGYCIYGYCVAEDTGSAINGNRVDLYFDSYSECIQFGRRSVTVYVLQTP